MYQLILISIALAVAAVNGADQCGSPVIQNKPGNGLLDDALRQWISRVVGGQAATPGSWPWQVQIKAYGSHYCGGSIINKDWVLTAGHCFDQYGLTTSPWSIHAGSTNKYFTDSQEQVRKVSKVVRHSKYDSWNIDNDVALMKVSQSFDFTSNYVGPVCLPSQGEAVSAGTNCYTTGFGETQGTGSSSVLKQAMVPIVSSTSCKSSYGSSSITNNMVCAGYAKGGHDACQGDSGGPLVCQTGSTWNVYGITSWGEGCAKPDRPGVYTKVSQYTSWIKSNTGM